VRMARVSENSKTVAAPAPASAGEQRRFVSAGRALDGS
jgi:hypothetical protein